MSGGADKATTAKDQNSSEKNEGEEPSSKIVLQQPGEVIIPDVPDGFPEKIAEEIYGLKVTKCKQLNGYDDKNYHLTVSSTSSNPHVTSVHPEGYVMKVVNSMDTKRPGILYSQIAFMQHLHSRGITVQDPVPSIQGENVVFYPFPSDSGGDVKTHAVCLRTFISGSILYDVTLSHDLCYKIGKFLASMTKAMEDFHHPFYEDFDHLWSLNNIPKLTEFVHAVTDASNRRVVDEVVENFCSTVLPRRSEIRAGYIHGDPNEQNILVKRRDPSSGGSDEGGEYVIAGILDFQDVARTHPLYDLAMNIAYVMLQATTFDPLEVGGHILAGYTSVLELPALERSLLRVSVASRLAQSLVLGAYSYSLDPSNEYLLVTAKRGWHVLHALWDAPADTLYQLWDQIQRSYTSDDDKK